MQGSPGAACIGAWFPGWLGVASSVPGAGMVVLGRAEKKGVESKLWPPRSAHHPPSFPGEGIFHCYMEYSRLRGEAGSDISLVDLGFQTDLRVYLHLRQTWMGFSESQPVRTPPPPCPCPSGSQAPPLGSSDNSQHLGSGHHPPAHLSEEENPHRHCSH